MNRRKWFSRIGVGILGLTGVLALAAFKGGGGHGHGFGHEGFFGARIDDMLEEVDATPQQREQVRAIADRLREKGRALRAERDQSEHAALVAQWEQGNLDRARLLAHVNERAERMKAFGQDVADAMIEVQNILTPEQRAKVAEKMRRHMERKEQRMERRGPPGARGN
jgi:Spy/CpxP family protein refolding chaperone